MDNSKELTYLSIKNIGRMLEFSYEINDNFNAYMICCSTFNNSEVNIDFKGSFYEVFALMNAIISEMAIKYNMKTLDVIELIKEGQIEYDAVMEGRMI